MNILSRALREVRRETARFFKLKPVVVQRTAIRKLKPVVVQRTAIRKGQAAFDQLTAALSAAGVPFAIGAAQDAWTRGVHIYREDVARFLDLVVATMPPEVRGRLGKSNITLTSLSKQCRAKPTPFFRLTVEEASHTNDLRTLRYVSFIEVTVWEEHTSYSEEQIFQCRSGNSYVHRLRASFLRSAMTEHRDLGKDADLFTYEFDFPIDAVYTWVDSNDPAWIAERSRFPSKGQSTSARGDLDERFRSRDELRYSLRSLETFAPWIRNVYLVTNGQKPAWLNEAHPRLKVVSHREIYRDPSVLPTFNSSGIETQLHHIDGLAEHFLYFNDDFLLGRFCVPSNFFHANGVMKFFPSIAKAVDVDIDATREGYLVSDYNAVQLMRRDHHRYARDIMVHAPYPARRSLLYKIEATYQEEFDRSARQRFRSHYDLRPIAFMGPHYGFLDGVAVPGEMTNNYLPLWRQNIEQRFEQASLQRSFHTLCINDVGIPPERLGAVNEATRKFMEDYLPFPSQFESPNGIEGHNA